MVYAGWSEVDITPEVGTPLAGYLNLRRAEKVLDPLKVTTLYLKDEEYSLAIISCDLCFLPNQFVKEVKDSIEDIADIDESQIMISATHTHSGPLTGKVFGQNPDQLYIKLLKEKIAESFSRAYKDTGPATFQFAQGSVEGISFNRRYLMRDGNVVTNPPKDNPEIIGPQGPVDRTINLIRVNTKNKEASLIIMNFALHLDTLNHNYISSDFVGIIRRILKKVYGSKTSLLYLQGSAGDINHLDPEGKIPTYNLYNRVRIGRVIAGEILKRLESTKNIENPILASIEKKIEVKLRLPSPAEVEEAREILRRIPEEESAEPLTSEDLAVGSLKTKLFYAREMLNIPQKNKETMKIQAMRIGDIAFVGIPAEVFMEIGITIKEKSPFPVTIIVELANGCFGYLPTEKAFSEGGYETLLNSYNRLAPDTESKVISASLSLLKSLSIE